MSKPYDRLSDAAFIHEYFDVPEAVEDVQEALDSLWAPLVEECADPDEERLGRVWNRMKDILTDMVARCQG